MPEGAERQEESEEEHGSVTWGGRKCRKETWKKFKNPLTNGTECDILNKLSQRAVANGTLKIEQRKTRKQSKERRKDEPKNSLNSKEVHTIQIRIVIPKEKVKRANQARKGK